MCLFTHFAAGALAGGLTGNVWYGAAAGAASHAVLDAIPHYDHPDWRLELSAGVFSLFLLLLMPFATWAAAVGGIFGMLPDLENLFQKLGKMRREQFIFPSHTGLIPHGRTLGPRSLVWQLAIFVLCFGLLGLLSPDAANAAEAADVQPVMGEPVVHLLSSDQNLTRIQVNCPVVREPADWASVPLDEVQWGMPLSNKQDDDGTISTHPPELVLNFAVPTRGAVFADVVNLTWWKEPETPVVDEDLVSFELPAVFREVPITGTNLPVGIGGGILRSAVIEIHHQPGPGFSRQIQAAAQSNSEDKNAVSLDKAPWTLLNPELYTELARGGRVLLASEKSEKHRGLYNPFDLTGNWVRLSIDENGLHRLSGQELSSMGVSTSSIDPAKIRLFRGGGLQLDRNPEIPEADQADRVGLTEVAIQVLDGQDGEWNLDDEIRFYGFSTDFWTDRIDPDALHLDHYNHPYQTGGVYWLTWENLTTESPISEAPLRVGEIDGSSNGGTNLSMAKMRLHVERQSREGYGMVVDDWVWDSNIFNTKTMGFELHTPVPDSSATYVIDYRGYTIGSSNSIGNYEYTTRAWINSDTGNAQDGIVISKNMIDSLRIRLVGSSDAVVDGGNVLSFQSTNPERRFAIILDSFDVFYWANLNLFEFGGQLEFAHWMELVEFDGQEVNLQVTVPSTGQVVMWDVGDTKQASVVNYDQDGTLLTCGLTLDSSLSRHFLVTTEDELHRVASGQVETPVDLRAQPTDAHYLVVYADDFGHAAQELTDFRSSFLPGISSPQARMVRVGDIYDNFSGGQKDVMAIRNYIKRVYEDGGGNLRYVCLLGNGTRDHRNLKNQNPNTAMMDLLPAHHRNFFPTNVGKSHRVSPYGSDDTMVSFDAPASFFDVDFPDVACGRLPAISVEEANWMVDKMIQYSSTVVPGLWSNRVLMVADDGYTPKYNNGTEPEYGENAHTAQTQEISQDYLPASIDQASVIGAYYDFPPGSRVKPLARQDINSFLNEGVTLFNYVGHGAENNLSDEQMFQSQDIGNLTNGMKRGVFIAFSCDVGVYDSPSRRSMAETFITSENGGTIASICASQTSYIFDNERLSEFFYGALFPDQHVSATQTLSAALLEGKANMGNADYRHNSQRYTLLGDPALRLPHPVDDLNFAEASLDTLRAGTRQVAVIEEDGGLMLGSGDTYSLLVEESSHYWPYIYDYYTNVQGDRVARWDSLLIKGATVFEGSGTMNSSELRVPFKAPVQLRYGERARMRLLLSSLDETHAANVALSAVRQALGPNDDLVGPHISLAFENNRHRVKAGTQLTATLQDTSSIAMLGTAPGNSLLLEFDNSGFMTDVTSSFQFDPDSYTSGSISFPLPHDMPWGNHQAALHASDMLGNVGNDTISFVIVPENVVGMESITLFPNPTVGPCRLLFELSDPMVVNWEIYTLSGRRIYSVENSFSAGPQIIHWDGRDDQKDEIANGTYLYVLRGVVTGGGDRDIIETGKLVIMR